MSKGAVTRLYWSLVDMTTQLSYGKLILEFASERHSTLILYPLHEPLTLQNVTRLGFMCFFESPVGGKFHDVKSCTIKGRSLQSKTDLI